ncbi:hypothetical protein LHU53_07630 [Rhodoferax sp. U2-2l]|uniref:hypothetical protein n=1 Tax=Rhodoferax sp. U2-2l TaxID=2884000 RepID=UPI001D0BB367|nr:hypothetical protein [Rhodoferax sp. U2-2l]MCB8746775.1 hypothetical protein [Rhodoferax sp. U2-2l]
MTANIHPVLVASVPALSACRPLINNSVIVRDDVRQTAGRNRIQFRMRRCHAPNVRINAF